MTMPNDVQNDVPMAEPLIRMTGIQKIFFTDEVETHALADIHLDIRPGEYVAINGPSGCSRALTPSLPDSLQASGMKHLYRLVWTPLSSG